MKTRTIRINVLRSKIIHALNLWSVKDWFRLQAGSINLWRRKGNFPLWQSKPIFYPSNRQSHSGFWWEDILRHWIPYLVEIPKICQHELHMISHTFIILMIDGHQYNKGVHCVCSLSLPSRLGGKGILPFPLIWEIILFLSAAGGIFMIVFVHFSLLLFSDDEGWRKPLFLNIRDAIFK